MFASTRGAHFFFHFVQTHLGLGETNMCDDGLLLLAGMLQHNTTLRELHVHTNGISDSGLASLCTALQQNSGLSSLDAANNSIGDMCVQQTIARILDGFGR